MTNEVIHNLLWIESVRYLKLAGNDITPWDAPQFTRFVKQRCAISGSRCSGLPYAGSGFSCTAFGSMARLKLDAPNECDKCDGDQTGTILLILLMTCLLLICLTAYVIIILKFPEALRRWVSFAIILVNHTQTLSIIGSLNLTWPPTVKMILSALTLFQIESASCLLPPNIPSFWLYAFGVLSLSLITLSLITLAMTYYDSRGRSGVADRLEFALTVLFSTLFVYSLQVCSVVVRENLTADEVYLVSYLARIAGALAVSVLLLICALVSRFWHKVAAYRRAVDGRGWNEGGWCTSRGPRVYPRSLGQRVFYLTHRFGMHAQTWQFVVWARQLALIILIGVNEVIAYRYHVQVKYIRYLSTGVGVVIILVALRWHVKVAPYAYKSQNALESFLMICNVLLLSAVYVYQTLADIERGLFLSAPEANINVSEYQQSSLVADLTADPADALVEPPFMGHDLPIFVATEILMIVLLGLSFFSTALYVVYDVRAKRRALEDTDPTLVLTAAEIYFDGPIRTALQDGRMRLVSCDWMLSAMGGGALTSILAPQGSGWPLPDEAYLSPDVAIQLLARGDRSVFMLSYAWQNKLSPDPHLRILKSVRAYLGRQGASGCGLYWDVFSMRESNMQKSIVDDVVSDTDLSQLLCASVTGTVVCCMKRPAVPLPPELEGHVLIYDYAQYVSDKALVILRKQSEVEEDEIATYSEADKSAPERRRREGRPTNMSESGSLPVSVTVHAPASHSQPHPMRLRVSSPIDTPREESAGEEEEPVFLAMPTGTVPTGTVHTRAVSTQPTQIGESYRAAFEQAIKHGGPQSLQAPLPRPGDLPPPSLTPKTATFTYREKLAAKLSAVRAEKAAVLMATNYTPGESGSAASGVEMRSIESTPPPQTPPPSPPPSLQRKRFGLDPVKAARRANKTAELKAARADADEKRAKERAIEQALRTKLHKYARVISCSLVGAHAHVRFDSHEGALKAVADPELACDLVHLDKPFDERGHCIAEEGIARIVIAHLNKSEDVGQLPSRFIVAQARRPKLVYVSDDGDARPCEVNQRPDMALAKMRRELKANSTHFCGKDERDNVSMGVAQIEYLIDRSMDEATQLQQLDRFTISPALIEQLRLISSVEVRPPKGTCPVICIRSPCKSGALITFSGGFEGLHVGAVIVAINGAVVSGQASVEKLIIAQCSKSGAAELTLARRSRREKIDRGTDGVSIGVSLCASPRGIGALVCKVRPSSLAEKHDVRQGDTILSVNATIGESPEHVLELIQSDRVADLVLERFTKDISFLKVHLASVEPPKEAEGSFIKSEGSFTTKSECSTTKSEDGDVEEAPAAGLEDDIMTLDGVSRYRRKRAHMMPSSTNQAVKRANFLLHIQVQDEHSAYVNNEVLRKQLVMPLSMLVWWALSFFKEGRGPSGPFAPLAAINVDQLVKENRQIRVFADATEVPDMNEVQLIALVKSQYKPVRIDIQLVSHAVNRQHHSSQRPSPRGAASPAPAPAGGAHHEAYQGPRAPALTSSATSSSTPGSGGMTTSAQTITSVTNGPFECAICSFTNASGRKCVLCGAQRPRPQQPPAQAPHEHPAQQLSQSATPEESRRRDLQGPAAFAIGARVVVRRTDGFDHVGTVGKHDPNRGLYKIVFDDGSKKIVRATELCAANMAANENVSQVV